MDLSQKYAEGQEGPGEPWGGAPALQSSQTQLRMTTLDGEGQTGGNAREGDAKEARRVHSVHSGWAREKAETSLLGELAEIEELGSGGEVLS